jgi:hypothetical protein
MAVPITRRGQRVHGVDLVAGADEGGNEQAPVRLDADDYVAWFIGVVAHEVAEG